MAEDSVDWKDLREFKAVDLTQSFILSWEIVGESLQIDIDLYLLPGHAFYEKPRPAEGACFRPALLEFPYCTRVANLSGKRDAGLQDSVNSLGPGRISAFKLVDDGQYNMDGGFGRVEFNAERPILRLKSQIS